MIQDLALYQRCAARIRENWNGFLDKRRQRLAQQQRHGVAAEKVAENILEDLFVDVLDWGLDALNNQLGYADLVLTSQGLKYLVLEVKRPGALAWNRGAATRALEQAVRYADEQKVRRVAISDGVMLYAADRVHGGLQDRVFVSLQDARPPESLWWLSLHGIDRVRTEGGDARLVLLPEPPAEESVMAIPSGATLFHTKYQLPATCFAYVGNAGNCHSWRLPYLQADGQVDTKRLPKAVQAILSNYRGARVSGIPEAAIPEVLVRLALAASRLGKLPHQAPNTSRIYHQLVAALEQLGRLDDVVPRASD